MSQAEQIASTVGTEHYRPTVGTPVKYKGRMYAVRKSWANGDITLTPVGHGRVITLPQAERAKIRPLGA